MPSASASAGLIPLARAYAKVPTNASPAPVVSITSTVGAEVRIIEPSALINAAPREPRVTTEFLPGRKLFRISSLAMDQLAH